MARPIAPGAAMTAPLGNRIDRPPLISSPATAKSSLISRDGGWFFSVADMVPVTQRTFLHAPYAPIALTGFSPGMGLPPGELVVPVRNGGGQADRWSGAAWLLWRQDDALSDPVPRTRLSGPQAGMRIDYLLAPSSPLRPTLYGRLSTALHGIAAAEVATGIGIRPMLPFPVIVAVERREGVSRGGRSDFAVLVAGGIDPVTVAHGLQLDGYGQAGFVGVDRRDAFADGRLTLERPVHGEGGASGRKIAVGVAVWGGAQPGASRLDIGPQASIHVQMGRAALRLGAEWRAQVAGNAGPSSGPALSLGASF